MTDCIFCKIASKEIPANIVYEDADFLAILDIHPVQKGHVVLIPKQHFRWIQELPDELIIQNALLVKKLTLDIIKLLAVDYVQILVEGIQVAHAHTHLIPSMLGTANATWHLTTYAPGEDTTYLEKLKDAFK